MIDATLEEGKVQLPNMGKTGLIDVFITKNSNRTNEWKTIKVAHYPQRLTVPIRLTCHKPR